MTSAEESKEKEEEEAFADVGAHRAPFKRKTLLDAPPGLGQTLSQTPNLNRPKAWEGVYVYASMAEIAC
jgi:hypothetical protein